MQHQDSIHSINRSENKLESLQGVDFLKKGLIDLNIDVNMIETLHNLPKSLKRLSASANHIQDCTGLGNMPLLEELNLSRNQIEIISGMGTPSLKQLDFSFNKIRIVGGLDKCKNLEIVNLSNNELMKIKAIPPINRVSINLLSIHVY